MDKCNQRPDADGSDQFDKIGPMPGEVRLSVNKNIHPQIDALRKKPITLKEYIKQEFDNMVKNKILQALIYSLNLTPKLVISLYISTLNRNC